MLIPFTNLRSRVSFAFLALVIAAAVMVIAPMPAWGQSATGGGISGVVVDPSNAVIVGAKVTLQEQATNVAQSTVTDSTGRYSFPAVKPGDYTLTVSQTGFQTSVVGQVHVNIDTAYTYNFTMKLGQASQTVEVTSNPGAALQTANASIGATIGGEMLQNLPTIQRNVSSLLGLQPAVTPMTTNDVMGGQVAGAASDQTTFLVDGGDATSDMEGTNNYVAIPGEVEPAPFIQVGIETTQEFRVVSAGPTSDQNRSQGGQISIVTKSGTNAFHGDGYEYYEGAHFDANSWVNNASNVARPNTVNNRFGGSVGGPIMKNRFWFFGNYEGRRFRQSGGIITDVPTQNVRNGILTFDACTQGVDSFGNCAGIPTPTQYNLATSTVCGPTNTSPCDNRTVFPEGFGPGIDPLIQSYWNLEPLPNNANFGDGLNSEGYVAAFPEPDNENYGLARLDYKINDRWTLFGTMREQKIQYYTGDQFDIIPGQQGFLSSTPIHPRFATFGLTGAVGSSFTNEVHGDYMIDSWGWLRAAVVNPGDITGLGGVLQVSGEGATGGASAGKAFADPINFNTQNARARVWDGRDWYLADDASWLHGNHTISFGGSWYFWNIIHQRTDNVLGGLTNAPIYWVGAKTMSSGSFVAPSAEETPPACSDTLTANCLQASDVSRWDTMYASMLGLVDHSSQVATANGQFQLNPLGTPATDHVHLGSFYTYAGDSWHLKPTITLTYGVSWGVQGAPRELNGEQVLQQYASTGTAVENIPAYFAARNASLDRGNPYPSLDDFTNPSFEFSPIGAVPGHSHPISPYWGSVGPHVALAWQVPWQNRFFGDNHNTVVRVGYSLEWNRTNAVSMVLTPLLGDGLMQIVGCNGPNTAGVCTGNELDATQAFRIGEDGNSLPPPVGRSGYPLVPPAGLGSTYGFNLDPAITPPWSHNVTFDLQRSFAHDWLVDFGYIGRWTHNLESGGDINASDMFATDPVSGQTLAQAFQNVANWTRSGGNCQTVSGVLTCPGLAVQPFFEDMAVPGGSPTAGANYCQTTYNTSCTNEAAAGALPFGYASNGDLGSFMEFNYNFIASAPLDPTQFVFNFWNWGGGWSNYNAGFVQVKKTMAHGLNVNFSYTYSHALGTQTLNQQYIIYGNASPFDPATGYTEEPYDTRNVFNAAVYYVLPFGKGQQFATGNNVADRIIGGWWLSGIWTWQSGQPQCIEADGDYGDIAGASTTDSCATSSISNLQSLVGLHNLGGGNLNIFANPSAVQASLSRPDLTTNLRPFNFNFAGFPLWNLDMSVGKNIIDTERFKGIFTADFFDIFNAFVPGDPDMDMDNPAIFGVVSGQQNNPRVMQFGLKFQF